MTSPKGTERAVGSRHFLTDLGTSLVAQILVVGGNLATLRVAASLMSPEDVGQFALVRRVLVFLTQFLMLGLGVSLPRCLGRLASKTSDASSTILAGWLAGATLGAFASIGLASFPGGASRLLFGDASATHLVQPMILLVFGYQNFLLVYASLRGRIQVRAANWLQVIHVAILPPVMVLLTGSHGVHSALMWLGAGSCTVAGIAVVLLVTSTKSHVSGEQIRRALRELGAYGLPRVPGDLALAGMYALGPLLLAHNMDIQAAGKLAIGMSLLTILSVAFGPLGLVLLPRLSRSLAREGDATIRTQLPMLLQLSAYGAAFLAIVGSMFGNQWLKWLLGSEFVIEPTALTSLMLAAGANVVFVILRSVVDASYFRPVNAINAIAALTVLLLVWASSRVLAPGGSFLGICVATGTAFVVLAVLTFIAVGRRYRLSLSRSLVMRWTLVQLGTIVLIRGLLEVPWRTTPWLIMMQILSAGSWLYLMSLVGVRWPKDLLEFLLRARKEAVDMRRMTQGQPSIPRGRSAVPSWQPGESGPVPVQPKPGEQENPTFVLRRGSEKSD